MENLRFNGALIDVLNGHKIYQKSNQCVQN